MYSAVLSVLLMGVFPLLQDARPGALPLASLPIAPPSPIVEHIASSPVFQSVSASGIVVLDIRSGQQLYARNPQMRRPMGSLTKLMTALLIVENHALDEKVTVPSDLAKVPGSKSYLRAGQEFTVGDLLSALLIVSSNEAAETLARFHSGTESAFVRAMNARAAALGLKNTAFANASGFDDTQQWSTSRDIALLALYVLRRDSIRSRMSTKEATVIDSRGRELALIHTHELMHESSAVIAGKTGTTAAAKQCLLSIVREGDDEYAVVLLGSRDRYDDMRAILQTLGQPIAKL